MSHVFKPTVTFSAVSEATAVLIPVAAPESGSDFTFAAVTDSAEVAVPAAAEDADAAEADAVEAMASADDMGLKISDVIEKLADLFLSPFFSLTSVFSFGKISLTRWHRH